MAKWFLAIIFLAVFPFAAFAQDDAAVMQTWVQQKFGIHNPEISQAWKSMPVVSNCDYEWYVRWNDARFQIKDNNENYYRVSYQGDTLTLDFKRDFNMIFGG